MTCWIPGLCLVTCDHSACWNINICCGSNLLGLWLCKCLLRYSGFLYLYWAHSWCLLLPIGLQLYLHRLCWHLEHYTSKGGRGGWSLDLWSAERCRLRPRHAINENHGQEDCNYYPLHLSFLCSILILNWDWFWPIYQFCAETNC